MQIGLVLWIAKFTDLVTRQDLNVGETCVLIKCILDVLVYSSYYIITGKNHHVTPLIYFKV